MTVESLAEDAPDVEDFIVCWLQPAIRAAMQREADDPLPFCVVAGVTAIDDVDAGFNASVVQLDVFARGIPATKAAVKTVRRRMNQLARHLDNVTMSDNSIASANYVQNQIDFERMDYADDQIVRYVARYGVGLSFVAV